MKRGVLIIICVIALLLVSGCAKKQECKNPFILKAGECCIDKNMNKICDKDESSKELPQKKPSEVSQPESSILVLSEQEKNEAISFCREACSQKDETKYNNPGFTESVKTAGYNKCTDFPELEVFEIGCASITVPEEPLPQPHIFKVGFIVDRDTIPYTQATRAEIEEAIALANDMLRIRNVNIQFLLQDIQNVNMGGYDTYMGERWSVSGYIDDYYRGHIVSPPNGVAIFREDSVASLFGGYTVVSSNLVDYGFCNNFQSSALGNSYIYGGVHDWDHMYAACGYDSNLDSSNGYDGNHISEVSIDGGCINSPGTPCVIHNGYYMCNNTDFENDNYARQRLSFIASNLIHEFLHSFHPSTPSMYHYCTVDCPSSCELIQDYAGMCPITWENFANSWRSCSNIAH